MHFSFVHFVSFVFKIFPHPHKDSKFYRFESLCFCVFVVFSFSI